MIKKLVGVGKLNGKQRQGKQSLITYPLDSSQLLKKLSMHNKKLMYVANILSISLNIGLAHYSLVIIIPCCFQKQLRVVRFVELAETGETNKMKNVISRSEQPSHNRFWHVQFYEQVQQNEILTKR